MLYTENLKVKTVGKSILFKYVTSILFDKIAFEMLLTLKHLYIYRDSKNRNSVIFHGTLM